MFLENDESTKIDILLDVSMTRMQLESKSERYKLPTLSPITFDILPRQAEVARVAVAFEIVEHLPIPAMVVIIPLVMERMR